MVYFFSEIKYTIIKVNYDNMEVLCMVDKQVIEEIKNNANIVEVIGDVISLQRQDGTI